MEQSQISKMKENLERSRQERAGKSTEELFAESMGVDKLHLIKISSGRRKKDETSKRQHAIRNHCLECCGWSAGEVRLCTAEECHLWPWRFGAGPPRSHKKGKDVDEEIEEVVEDDEDDMKEDD